jgi:hypothetical protein
VCPFDYVEEAFVDGSSASVGRTLLCLREVTGSGNRVPRVGVK